jgi:hypothetical protein
LNYADWKREIYRLDGGVCRNKDCNNIADDPHHILFGRPKVNELWNGICLCRTCHKTVHEGFNLHDRRMTGREYMIFILEQGHKDFRWQEAYDELKKKPRRR